MDAYLAGGNSKILYFHPYLGKIPILTNIFQLGWNHQLDTFFVTSSFKFTVCCESSLSLSIISIGFLYTMIFLWYYSRLNKKNAIPLRGGGPWWKRIKPLRQTGRGILQFCHDGQDDCACCTSKHISLCRSTSGHKGSDIFERITWP